MWRKRLRPSSSARALSLLCCLVSGQLQAKLDFSGIAVEHGVDPVLLYSVALAESARPINRAEIAPWPWTINSLDGPRYFNTRQEAEKYLRSLLEKGVENIDIGLMQINLKFNRARISDPVALLNPETNLRLGARLLREALESSADAVLAVGRYHSGKIEKAYGYGYRIWKIYYRLLPHFDRF
jgi:hypothetical protein